MYKTRTITLEGTGNEHLTVDRIFARYTIIQASILSAATVPRIHHKLYTVGYGLFFKAGRLTPTLFGTAVIAGNRRGASI